MKINVSIRILKQSKHIEEGTMGTIEKEGNHYKIYVLNTPDYIPIIAHELGHVINSLVLNAPQTEELAESFEDITRKWIRNI